MGNDIFGMEIRKYILSQSLMFEKDVGALLKVLLDLDDNNLSFGNTSAAMSFNTKVNLLLDLKYIIDDDKAVITNFMAIRNQFIHNQKAVSYTSCVSSINGLAGYFKKKYKHIIPPDASSSEDIKEKYFGEVVRRLVFSCIGIMIQLGEKYKTEYEREWKRNYQRAEHMALEWAFEELSNEAKETENPDIISISELRRRVKSKFGE